MRVEAMNRGEKALHGADCVTIYRLSDGEFQIRGLVSDGRRVVEFGSPEERYRSESKALNAGLRWAQSAGCTTIFVERPV